MIIAWYLLPSYVCSLIFRLIFQALITCWLFQLVLNKRVMLMLLFERYDCILMPLESYKCSFTLEMLLHGLYVPNFSEFSFFQRILQLYYFIMMAMWMDGGMLSGVRRQYT